MMMTPEVLLTTNSPLPKSMAFLNFDASDVDTSADALMRARFFDHLTGPLCDTPRTLSIVVVSSSRGVTCRSHFGQSGAAA